MVWSFLVLLSIVFSSCAADTQTSESDMAVRSKMANTAKVVSIADGDTFTVLHENKTQEKIRLYGIDCPEQRQDFGSVAKNGVGELVFEKMVRIERKYKDRNGRTVAVVYLQNGVCVNEEMLRRGLAWHFKRYDNSPAWAEIENIARFNKAGLWARSDAVAPWEWRRFRKTK